MTQRRKSLSSILRHLADSIEHEEISITELKSMLMISIINPKTTSEINSLIFTNWYYQNYIINQSNETNNMTDTL